MPYLCGCWFVSSTGRQYLPQVELQSHTTILATTSSTILKQTFINPTNQSLKEVSYTFPLYDGVSVAGFRCVIADRSIVGIVKERNQARTEYKAAIDRGEMAGLFQQDLDAADVFTTSIGNIPAGEKAHIEITYLGELKNDAETDGARFTIPTKIAPRYGQGTYTVATGPGATNTGGIKITVDVQLEKGVAVRGIQSPSHPVAITMGRISTIEDDDVFESNLASSSLTLGTTELDKDFIIVVQAKGQDTPRALLETHPTLPNQRVLMTTLVPKFNMPNEHPEVVFVVDRSGSMHNKMHLVAEALKVFLKSLPVSVKFNICSFGSHHTFLFDKSRTYDAESLQIAMNHISFGFSANYGGTEMLQPVQSVLKRRYKDLPLEVMLLTDGEIWNQQALFDEVNAASEKGARFFTLGIGSSASSSLVEGIARAGRGFSQWVNDGERIDKRIVRMLKGALTPHIKYKLEINYDRSDTSDEEEYEIVESFEKSMDLIGRNDSSTTEKQEGPKKKIISLFTSKSKDDPPNPTQGRYDHLPNFAIPNVLQTPSNIPELYPHSRSTIYLVLGPESCQRTPSSVVLRGTTEDTDLELEIPIQDIGQGTTLHQLAAKKAMQELEQGRGWLTEAKAAKDKSLKSKYEGKWDLIVEREAVRLGTRFQVGGKFCSFVAVEDGEDGLPAYESAALQSDTGKTDERRKRNAGASARFRCRSKESTDSGLAVSQAAHDFSAPRPPVMKMSQQQQQSPMVRTLGGGGLFGNAPPPPPAPSRGGFGINQLDRRRQSSESKVQSTFQPTGGSMGPGVSTSIFGTPLPFSQPGGLFGTSSPGSNASAFENSNASAFGNSNAASPSYSPVNSPGGFAAASYSSGIIPAGPSARSGFSFGSLTSTASPSAPMALKEDSASHSMFSSKWIRKAEKATDFEEEDEGLDFASIEEPQSATVTSSAGLFGMSPAATASRSHKTQSLSPLEKMQQLIDLQTFTGSWKVTDQFLVLVSHRVVESSAFMNAKALVKQVMAAVEKDQKNVDSAEYGEDVCATIVAIAWLEMVVEDEKDVWEMVVEKAKEWLEGRIDGSDRIEKITTEVKKSWTK